MTTVVHLLRGLDLLHLSSSLFLEERTEPEATSVTACNVYIEEMHGRLQRSAPIGLCIDVSGYSVALMQNHKPGLSGRRQMGQGQNARLPSRVLDMKMTERSRAQNSKMPPSTLAEA